MTLINMGAVVSPAARTWSRFPVDDGQPDSAIFLCEVTPAEGVRGWAYFRRKVRLDGQTAATRAEKHYADGSVKLLVSLPIGELPLGFSEHIEVMFIPWLRGFQSPGNCNISFQLFKWVQTFN